MNHLPQPDKVALNHSQILTKRIKQQINQNHNWISFADYMQMALYEPQYGYYAGGLKKFGVKGDFITAPELTPLFGQALAKQIHDLLPQTAGNIYEFGAGSGQLASTLLNTLSENQFNHYYIIELSADLISRQQHTINTHAPHLAHKVKHLAQLPATLDGILLGNEVLDAMPVPVYQRNGSQIAEMGVSWQEDKLVWQKKICHDANVCQQILHTFPQTATPYQSELHPRQYAFIATLAEKLERGAMIWIDYGFDASQYYHPQRQQGTLIGHYRHHVIHDVFFNPGLTDLTSHVNFTRIADAGIDHHLDLIGYTSQSTFLLNLDIIQLLEQTGKPDEPAYIAAATACQTLLAPQEMGELFKVIAFGKKIDPDWRGFSQGDQCHKL